MKTSDRRPFPRTLPLLAISAAVAVESGAPVWARALAAMPLILYLPGVSLVAAAFPGTARTLETNVLAVAMSLASTVLLGVALGLAGRLDAHAWEIGLCAVTIVGWVATLRKVRRPQAGFPWLAVQDPVRLSPNPRSTSGPPADPIPWSDLGLVAVALCIAAGAVGLARQGARAQTAVAHTDFWMVPEDADRPTLATIGIRNAEGRDAAYHVDILQRGHLVDEWPVVVLKPGATFTSKVAFDPRASSAAGSAPIAGPEGSRVEARLYEDGAFGEIYRKAWVALPTPPKAPGTER